MNTYTLIHEWDYTHTIYTFQSENTIEELHQHQDKLIDQLGIDYEPERGESIEIEAQGVLDTISV